jgi:hypothetical protein
VKSPANSFYHPGGDFGGPVLIPGTRFNKNHDKLFFYAAYEYMDQCPAGSLDQYFVPTPQMLQGNFTPATLSPYDWAIAVEIGIKHRRNRTRWSA